MSEIFQMRYLRLTNSFGKLDTNRKESKHKNSKSGMKYKDNSRGIFKHKLELLKENMQKEYYKGIASVKEKNKERELERTIQGHKTPINFDYEILPKINGNIKPMFKDNSKESLLRICEKGYTLSLPNHINVMKSTLDKSQDTFLNQDLEI
mmetsp:Transcript_22753/g.22596  ORF Transcript_22753/g.22596 Transcript_22753/m.22596 type:complete len:151 (-) Transcript_22753:143-595(-)|eukprot:CAMPEP_0197007868 /NCGR_PEP_ID=MMETSP1380-20130617/42624_1 /TAXON_ID=5936 /ORGANISM="Euplotes crassus, Strain CT5" /LENGTH=150 /DNA_ID=CAMNT_0042428163 /DNA_START=30 /DNA_END=482 /DNA_ORIENTATION=-